MLRNVAFPKKATGKAATGKSSPPGSRQGRRRGNRLKGQGESYVRRATKASSAGSAASGGSGLRRASRPIFISSLLASLATLLFLAPLAHADKGISGWIGSTTAPSGERGGELREPRGIAVNNTGAGGVPAGTLYVVDGGNLRVQVFGPDHQFVAAWGLNVTGINEVQTVNVQAGGGTFTLSYGGKTSAPLGFEANATQVTNALKEVIGDGNFTSTRAVNAQTGLTITITFAGTLVGTDVEQVTANGGALTGTNKTGGPASVKAETVTQGTGGNFAGYEICTNAPLCSRGMSTTAATAVRGSFSDVIGVAVDQADGSVYVSERGFLRVTKFTATGTPIWTVGKDVNLTFDSKPDGTPDVGSPKTADGPEVCPRPAPEFINDVCKGASTAAPLTAGGVIASTGNGRPSIAVVPPGPPNSGNLVVANAGNRRFDEFTSAGAFVRAIGWDVLPKTSPENNANNEVQKVNIPATDGTFTLKYGANTTVPLPYSASAAEVQAALNGLTSISTGGGSVTVSGGPGDATASSPYLVTFGAGPLADVDVESMVVNGRSLGAAPGKTVTCNGPSAQATTYQWLRDGVAIPGATSQSYVIQPGDAGAAVQCQVFASNETQNPGRAMTQTANPSVNVAPLPGTPRPIPPPTLPFVTATFLPGQYDYVGQDGGYTLHCNTGAWQNLPTSFKYQWYRSGVPLTGDDADTANYVVRAADIKSPALFQCAVTGINAGGGITAVTEMQPNDEGPDVVPLPNGERLSGVPNTSPSATQSTDVATVEIFSQGGGLEACLTAAECRAGVSGPNPGQFGSNTNLSPHGVAIDPSGAIYAVETASVTKAVQRVHKFVPSGGPAPFTVSEFAPQVLTTFQGSSLPALAVATTGSGTVLVLKPTPAGATGACLDGLPSKGERRVLEFSSDGSTLLGTNATCSGIETSQSTMGIAVNEVTDDIYYSIEGSAPNGHRLYIISGSSIDPAVSLDEPDPRMTTALITGAVNPTPTPSTYPNPPKASWFLQYKLSSESEWIDYRTPRNVGSGTGDVPIRITLTGLLPNAPYDVRVVARKEFDSSQVFGAPETFVTDKASPEIESSQARNLTASSADLTARISPRGTESSYYFEWGTTTSYGNTTPKVNIGDGRAAESAIAQISGLGDETYHFRVVAENEAGKSFGENNSFSFHPSNCPNSLVRQQTGAGYLPDCRAYELVSPEAAGNAIIDSFSAPSSSTAISPSRLAYVARYAPLPTGDNPPNAQDLYVATRTDTGWSSKFIGLPATEAFAWGGPPGLLGGGALRGVQADPALSRILLWRLGNESVPLEDRDQSNAPYVFGSDGSLLQRWPTNLESISGGEDFSAHTYQLRASEDLSHFVFSSDVAFLPGADPGDIYDNDTEAGTLQIASIDHEGNKFNGHLAELSSDGSHILMSTSAVPACDQKGCGTMAPGRLYMRVDGTETHDVTEGHNATFAGMTDNGSKVYFLSDEKVVDGETDTGTDLYMWSEESESITRVSTGIEGTGDTDNCDPVKAWTAKCGVRPISNYERRCRQGQGCEFSPGPLFHNGAFSHQTAATGGHPWTDNFLASESGDIYFYSPEKLDGDAVGAEGSQNLYLFREGEVRFVATMEPDPVCRLEKGNDLSFNENFCASGPIGRIQVTPDGSHVAFTTHRRLTGFDNAGIETMYRFEPGTGKLICVSCSPTGETPTSPVNGAMNGRFLTDDGRVFFTTTDTLQSDDTNEAQDVYEFVDGRPRLITAGTGKVREPICPSCGTGGTSRPGLIGVSAGGTDVYFGTYDVLTANDRNGGNLKIYNARTNGGFQVQTQLAPCEAADECHGPASTRPPAAVSGTGVALGTRGNVAAEQKAKKRNQRARKLKKKRRAAARRAAARRAKARRHG